MAVSTWAALGTLGFCLLLSLFVKPKKEQEKQPDHVRIHHPHYMEEDEYECSACKTRFRNDTMTCPSCGAHFSRIREDDMEFIEEMELYDGDEDDD